MRTDFALYMNKERIFMKRKKRKITAHSEYIPSSYEKQKIKAYINKMKKEREEDEKRESEF